MNTQEKIELAKEVCRGCDTVWDAIGYECLQLCDGNMKADEVVEMCVDADRLKTFGCPDADAAWDLLGEEFPGADGYAKQLQFVASQMPFQSYGY